MGKTYDLPNRLGKGQTIVLAHMVGITPVVTGYQGMSIVPPDAGYDMCWVAISMVRANDMGVLDYRITALVANEPAGFDDIESACEWLESERTKLIDAIEGR